ncbi:hypothetical protein F4083_03995 [Candidatus Poribacteria bacterium]|nr:hypothetical protein [Candidatus Poribacteria bacterium]MYB64909.1 hypothetical protein [Candidatus Poribacteria bacterium]MYI93473.1 hypothetical protein [Candidatus Poribacteria bacterium]
MIILELLSKILLLIGGVCLILSLLMSLLKITYQLDDIRKVLIVYLSLSLSQSESQTERVISLFKRSKSETVLARLLDVNPEDVEKFLKTEAD